MNKLKNISFLILMMVSSLLIVSCDDTTEELSVSNPTAPVLEALNFNMLLLDAVNTNNEAITLRWNKADYGQQTAVNYAIQVANDDVFTNPITATAIIGDNKITMSVAELNNAAGNAGLNPFEWATLYIRIESSIGTENSFKSQSNVISLDVYPYFNYVFDDYFIVGDATAPNWDNNNNNPALFRDAGNSNLFKYTGYFAAGHFKVLETKGLWQPQWGTNDGVTIDGNPATVSSDPERFPTAGGAGITTAGFYTFTIDFATKQYTWDPYTGTVGASPTTLTLEGSVTASAVNLTPLGFDGHMWYASAVRLIPGDAQFMADGNAWGADTSFSGIATAGGASIPVVVEDDYDIWFNDITGEYILIPLNL